MPLATSRKRIAIIFAAPFDLPWPQRLRARPIPASAKIPGAATAYTVSLLPLRPGRRNPGSRSSPPENAVVWMARVLITAVPFGFVAVGAPGVTWAGVKMQSTVAKGTPEHESETPWLKPFWGVAVMTVDTVPPATTEREVLLAVRVNPG